MHLELGGRYKCLGWNGEPRMCIYRNMESHWVDRGGYNELRIEGSVKSFKSSRRCF